MIINTVQLWFVKREKLLQPPRFCAYATFVLKIYTGVSININVITQIIVEHSFFVKKNKNNMVGIYITIIFVVSITLK